ncbi:MAG: ABC transporter permease [Planctomycetes bacterium]|nr:ABC transporter permease [Planctomycetota bacterium]
MYKLFLSLRYFRSRLIHFVPVVCMTLGVMALIVILAVMDGFQAQLRATLRGTLSDLIIRVNYESDFEKWKEILYSVEGVRAVSPHLQSFCLVAQVPPPSRPGEFERSALMDGAMVLGIDSRLESQVSLFRSYLKWREKNREREEWGSSTPDIEAPFRVFDRRYDDRAGVILGRQLAERLGVMRPRVERDPEGRLLRADYDRVYLTTMVRTEGQERYRAEQQDFCVTGIYESGNQEIDQHIAYLDRGDARKFFQFSLDPSEIRVQLADYESQKDRVKKQLNDRRQEVFARTVVEGTAWPAYLLPYTVYTWEDQRRNFLNAISNEKGLIAIIAGMAFIVTGFMIFSILSMIVTMKTRDIGILKALGGTTGGVLRIFLVNGLLVGLVGGALGLLFGLLFVHHINEIKELLNRLFGWEPFPQNIYLFSEIPTRVVPGEVAIVTGMGVTAL